MQPGSGGARERAFVCSDHIGDPGREQRNSCGLSEVVSELFVSEGKAHSREREREGCRYFVERERERARDGEPFYLRHSPRRELIR